MIPSTKARTRQRVQGALNDGIATRTEPTMTRQKQRDAKDGDADDSVNEARTRQREQGALKDEGIDLMVMPEGLKGRLPR